MTEPSERFPWETDDDAPLGPAVPEEPAASADLDLDVPLAPFLGPDGAVHSGDSSSDVGGAADPTSASDAPWLDAVDAAMAEPSFDTAAEPTEIAGFPDLDQYLSEPDAAEPVDLPDLPPLSPDTELPGFGPDLAETEPWAALPTPDALESAESPAVDAESAPWTADPSEVATGGGTGSAAEQPVDGVEPWAVPIIEEEVQIIEEEVQTASDGGAGIDPGWPVGAALEAERAAAGGRVGDEGVAGDAVAEAAQRLERIAASLRAGDLDALIRKGDPLEALVIGYLLGARSVR